MASNHSLPIFLKHLLRGRPRSPVVRCSSGKSFARVKYLRTGLVTPPSAWTHTGMWTLSPACSDPMVRGRWMFDCCRVPSIPVDWSVSYAGSPTPYGDLGHVVVVRNNRFWKLKAEVGGVVLGMKELMKSVPSIPFVDYLSERK